MLRKSDKPLITFGMFAYNQGRFVQEAIRGAFAQTYSPLEIILSDDCSSDRTFAIMREMAEAYRGPHTVILNRNESNLGIGGHVNRVMELSRGELIVIAAGDDISLPRRVERVYQVYDSTNGAAKSIFSNNLIINSSGEPQGLDFGEPVLNGQYSPENMARHEFFDMAGCSHAWSREVFDVFGPMMTPLTCEDRVIPFRSALLGEIKYIHEALVLHRRHEDNTWLYYPEKNIEKYMKHEKFWTFDRKAIYENWLKDLEKIRNLYPKRETEIRLLRNIVLQRLSLVEDDICLIKGNWPKRIKILVKKILEGEDLKLIKHKIGLFLIPGVYRKFHALKNRRRGKK